MFAMLGRLLRGLLRLALVAFAVAALAALARKLMGEVSGEPGVAEPTWAGPQSANGNGQRPHAGVPMSFDSWPPVPPAGRRSSD